MQAELFQLPIQFSRNSKPNPDPRPSLPDDLVDSQLRSEDALIEIIRKRLAAGAPFTKAGPYIIVAKSSKESRFYYSPEAKSRYSEGAVDLPPHLYSVSKAAYESINRAPSSIVLQGPSGGGKTFCALHLIDHLLELGSASNDLKNRVHAAFQALHIMSSRVNLSNVESTSASLVTEVWFDSYKNAIGVQFISSLWSTVEPQEGRSYQVLHSLGCASKSILQSLHLAAIGDNLFSDFQADRETMTRLKITDSETWQRFLQCLSIVGLHRQEVQALLEILAAVIILLEVRDAFSYQLGRDRQHHWLPHNRSTLQKLSKLLATTQDRLTDFFALAKDKGQAKDLAIHLAERLYTSAFKWLIALINSDLRPQSPVDKVTILDFPGFSKENSLSGLLSNLASESCNYYCAQSLFKLIDQLKREGFLLNLSPLSKTVLEHLIGERGFLKTLSNHKLSLQEVLLTLRSSQAFEIPNDYILATTWGTARYDITQLFDKARSLIDSSTSNTLMKGCSNRILAYHYSRVQTLVNVQLKRGCLHDEVSTKLSEVLQTQSEPYVVFCLPTKSSQVDLDSGLLMIKQSLVNPCLIWNWFGYNHWVKLEDLMGDLELHDGSKKTLKAKLESIVNSKHFLLGRYYALLSDAGHKILQESKTRMSWMNTDTTELSLCISESSMPQISQSSPFYSSQDSPMLKLDTSQMTQPTDISFELTSIQLGEIKPAPKSYAMYPPKLAQPTEDLHQRYFDRVSPMPENVIYVQSSFDFLQLTKAMQDFQNIDYTNCLPAVLRLQAFSKGIKVRKEFRAVRHIYRSAVRIQRWIRTRFALRNARKWGKIVQSVIIVQRKWRRKAKVKKEAAIKIQRWYLKQLTARMIKQQRRTKVPSKRLQEAFKQRAVAEEAKYTFSPQLNKHSQRLALKHYMKAGLHLPLPERAQILEMQKQHKLHKQRLNKAEEESRELTLHPQTLDKPCANDFFQRQAQSMMKYRQNKESLLHAKLGQEQAELTFAPKINAQERSRSPVRTVDDLYRWAEIKRKAKLKAQEEKELNESKSLIQSSILKTSTVMVRKKRMKEELLNEARRIAEQARSPHWPK